LLTTARVSHLHRDYITPRYVELDLGRSCVKTKLIANLFHGNCLVLHVVFANIPDDSNLMLHCLDSALEIVRKVRQDKGLSAHLPPNSRFQVDGVSTNWGKTVFAHFQHLVNKRVLGESCDVVRNPVGSTHEDVDALFALVKTKLKNADCVTFDALLALIRLAFATYPLPVTILKVDATLDYIEFYARHIDPKLSNFSYSPHDTGYHVLSFRPLSAEYPTGVAFKKYQQDMFVSVAISKDQLPEAVALALPDDAIFRPQAIHVESQYHHAVVLTTAPIGMPTLKINAAFDWDKVKRDVWHVVPTTRET
jgi:hypothetical protein